MANHIVIVAWIHIIFGIFKLVAGLILGAVFGVGAFVTGIAAPANDALVAVPIITVVGGFVVFLMLLSSLPGIIGGIGLLKYQNWGRIIIFIVAVLDLFNFPIGTAISIYSLWVTLSNETSVLFRNPTQAPDIFS